MSDGASEHQPLVSVVMSFHNSASTLEAAIRSMLLQTHINWELILLDDGSRDGSSAVVHRFNDDRIHLIGDGVCRGLPVRLNEGIRLARGEFIARMDADDVAFPERFEKQVAFLRTHPDTDLLATDTLMVDANCTAIGILAAAHSHEAICARPWIGFSMPHPTWMGRSEWFRRHPYDESAKKAQDQTLLLQTYRTSCFAGLAEPLLAYTYDTVSLKKSCIGRWNYIKSAWSSFRQEGNGIGVAAMATLYHNAALMRDVTGHLFGMSRRIAHGRVGSADPALLSKWSDLKEKLAHDVSR